MNCSTAKERAGAAASWVRHTGHVRCSFSHMSRHSPHSRWPQVVEKGEFRSGPNRWLHTGQLSWASMKATSRLMLAMAAGGPGGPAWRSRHPENCARVRSACASRWPMEDWHTRTV